MLPRTQILNANNTSIGISQDISTRSLQTVSVGDSAGKISTGTNNAFIGVQAGAQNTTGSYVTAVGFQAAAQNTNSSYATMIGAYAGAQNLSGNEVVFAGFRAGELNKYGGQHVGIGAYALRENVSGNASVAVGYRAGERTLDGGYNTMIGAYSGQDNRSGNFNTMGGYSAGRAAFLGDENTYFGAYAGYSNAMGSGNSLFGYRSGANLQNGDLNVAIGAYSFEGATFAYSNVIIGPFAARNQQSQTTNNVIIGTHVATNAEVSDSVIIGANAAQNIIGEGLVVIGASSANSSFIGNSNILIGKGANLFSDSNAFAISIGNLNTLTYTNSVSIGIYITNERENSVLIGNTLTSDAPQSVIIGNSISLQSVIFFKDSLYNAYQSIASADGSNILKINNIQYSDTLISPLCNIYVNATAGIITSNIVNSISHPQNNVTGPYSIKGQLPYNLLQNIANYNSNYAYANGTVYSIQTINDTSNTINSTTINNSFVTNTIYVSATSLTNTNPNPLYNTTYTYCNISSNITNGIDFLSNYYYIHEIHPYIQFAPALSNYTISTSNYATNTTSIVSCNMPMKYIPVVANITQLNAQTLSTPIYIAKTVAPPQYNYGNVGVTTGGKSSKTIYAGGSLLKSAIAAATATSSSAINISANIGTTAWNYKINSNFGIDLGSMLPHRCNLLYTVSILPKYGKLNNTIFDVNNINSITYTPFTEYAQNSQDTFEITPIFSITDYAGSNYGLQSSNSLNVNIIFNTPYREIYPANQITFQSGTIKTLSINDILLNSIPVFDWNNNPPYINVTNLDPNLIISSNNVQYNAANIATMTQNNISQYPASLAPVLYNNIVYSINTAVSCNLYDFNYNPTFGIRNALNSIVYDSSYLSNIIATTQANNVAPQLQTLSNITLYATQLINLIPSASTATVTASANLQMFIMNWNNVYDPTVIYTQTQNMYNNYTYTYYPNYITNNLQRSWSNLNIIQAAFNSYRYPLTSNVATNLLQTLNYTTSIFNNNNYLNSGLSAIPYTNEIYNSYVTFYNSYYVSPRLFISYNDLTSNLITLQEVSSLSSPLSGGNYSISFLIESSNITVPITTYLPPETWENITETTTIIIPTATSNLYSTKLDNLLITDYYIQQPPINNIGVISLNTSIPLLPSTVAFSLSNLSYSIVNPWTPTSSFDITVKNPNPNATSNIYLTKHFNFAYDTTIRTLPIKFGVAYPSLQNISQYPEYIINSTYTIQSNLDITFTSNQGILKSINQTYTPINYNCNVGYFINTSNITWTNTVTYSLYTGADIASNIFTSNIYTNYTYSNLYTGLSYNFTNSSNIIQLTPIYSYSYSNTQSTQQSNVYYQYTQSNIIYSANYYAYGNDTTILLSNQYHYSNYDYNTANYIYYSYDAPFKVQYPSVTRLKQITYQPGPYIINVTSNITLHYNYNRYESYQKINKELLYSAATLLGSQSNTVYTINYSNTNNINNTNNTNNTNSVTAPLLFVNNATGFAGITSWNNSNADNVYIKGLSLNATCNINIRLSDNYNNTTTINILTIPAINNVVNVANAANAASGGYWIGNSVLQINGDTMYSTDAGSSTAFSSIFNNDFATLNFTPTDINFIHVQKGSIVSNNTLITTASINALTNGSIQYLASGRYDNDTLQYFYSSNNVYASSNFTQNIHLIQSPAVNTIQSFNIGLSSYNNRLDPSLFYYSAALNNSIIATSNIGIRVKTISPQISLYNVATNTTGNIFNILDTSNIQFTFNNSGGAIVNGGYCNIIYDVFDYSDGNANGPVINGLGGVSLNIRTYEYYQFPLSNVDKTSLIIQNFANGLENVGVGTFWDKINGLYVQGQKFQSDKLQFIVKTYPVRGYIANAFNYSDFANNNVNYIPYSQLSDISELQNDKIKIRLLYNSNQISPEYAINIKNYSSRFIPRIVNASSFSNVAYSPAISGAMINDGLTWVNTSNNVFPRNTVESLNILWNLQNYPGRQVYFQENVATFNSSKTPTLPITAQGPGPATIAISVDESDSINMSFLMNYITNLNQLNNAVYFYITLPPLYGIIQDTLTGNTIVRFSSEQLTQTVYQHIGQNKNTDRIHVAVSSSPYDFSFNYLIVNINIQPMPWVLNNTSQYTYFNTSTAALSATVNIPSTNLLINSGYIHILDDSLSNINVHGLGESDVIYYMDNINFSFNQDYILNTQAIKGTTPYPEYGFDFTYNNSITPNYINRLATIPMYTSLYKNHFNGYLNKNTDINDIVVDLNTDQKIVYSITPNPTLYGPNIFSTLIQFQTKASLNTSQSEFLYNSVFYINYYQSGVKILSFTITKYNWSLTICKNKNGASVFVAKYTGIHNGIINNTPTTILVVNNDNLNNNGLSLYWNYNLNNTTNINLFSGYNISVDLSLLDSIEIYIPIKDPLNYIASSNLINKIAGGDLYSTFNIQNYNISHVFETVELYVGNSENTDIHNIILGKAIVVRGTNNICIGNTFSTSGNASLIIGNNIGGGGVNEINNSIIIGNDSFADSAVSKVISIGNSNLNYLRANTDPQVQQTVNRFLSQYPILIGNTIDFSKIDFNINIGNTFLKTTVDPTNSTGENSQIYLGNSGEKVGIGYASNVGLTDMLSVNGDIRAHSISVNNLNINSLSIKNLSDTISCINAISITPINLNYIVSSTGVYSNGILNARTATLNDYNIIGICLGVTAGTVAGTENIVVGINGHMQVWCKGIVNAGDFLTSDADGIAYSVGHQTITQNITATVAPQSYVVRKVINGMPVFVGGSQASSSSSSSSTSSIELISNYTFAKSTTTWDPNNPVSWVNTTYVNGDLVGLISCIITN